MVDEATRAMLRKLLKANGVLERDRDPVLFINALQDCREIVSAELHTPGSEPLCFERDISENNGEESSISREYRFDENILVIATSSELAAEIIGEFDLSLLSPITTESNNENPLPLDDVERIADIGSWEYDLSRNVFQVSKGWQKIHGSDKSELTPEELASFIGIAKPEEFISSFKAKIAGKSSFIREAKITVDDQERWIRSLGAVKRAEDGRPTRIFGICVNITKSRENEIELNFQSLVLEHIQDLITATDLEGRITYVNDAVCRQLGRSREELLGDSVSIFGEDRGTVSQQQIIETTKNGGYDGEVVNIAGDGSRVHLDVRTNVLRNRDGDPIGMLGISTDITEKRKAREDLRRSEENYRTLAEHSSDIILRFDREFRFMYISPGMEKLWNEPVADFKGMTMKETGLPPKMYDTLEHYIGKVFKTGMPLIEKFSMPLLEESLVLECRMTPEVDAQGTVASVILYAGNVTEIENAIHALEDSEEKYQTLFEMSPFGILVLKKQRYIMGNAAAARTLGLSGPEAIAGTSPLDFLPDEIEDTGKLHTLSYRLTEHPIETELKQVDGNIIVTEVTSIPISFEGEAAVLILLQDITERKRAQESLRRNEIFLHAIFNSISEPITVMDRAMKIRHANDASKALHRDKLPLEGKMCIEVFENIGCKECAVRKTFDTGLPQKIVKSHQDDGVIYQITTYPIHDRDGTTEFVVEAMYDITERVQYENRIIDSERRLHEAQRIARLGTWEWEVQAEKIRLSGMMHEMLGIDSDPVDLPEIFLQKIVHPDDYQSTMDFFDAVADENRSDSTDFRSVSSDGTVMHFYCRANPVTDDQGNVFKVIGIIQDISTIKNIQFVLKEKVNELQTILGSIPEAIIFTDIDRRVKRINSAFTKMFGLNPRDIVGKSTSILYIEKDEFIRQGQERYNSEARPSLIPYEGEYRRKDGSVFPAETIGFPVTDASGHIAGFIGIVRDITERRRLEDEKVKLEEQLRRIQKLETIGTMAGGIAHDFNNLLSPILGYSELAVATVSASSPAQDYLTQIRKSANKARNLVKQILIFSRQVDQRRKPVYLDKAVEESIELLRSTLPKSIELKVTLNRYTVLADPTEIHQIVVNFVTNSWHAMPDEKGEICLAVTEADISGTHLTSLLPEGRYACLSVSDNGMGIPQDVLQRIFEPFFTTKDLNRGTGLGLSVVHGLVQSLGGTITCDSTENVGTRFDVFLPIMDSKVLNEKKEIEATEPGSGRILVVDDEKDNTYLYRKLLTGSGYTVTCSNDPVEALDMLEGIDLLLTDMTMPGMSGLDLVQEIRKRGIRIPVIVMTGYSEKLTVDYAKEIGVSTVLLKPLTTAELTAAIHRAMGE